jgi:hypothetical protein
MHVWTASSHISAHMAGYTLSYLLDYRQAVDGRSHRHGDARSRPGEPLPLPSWDVRGWPTTTKGKARIYEWDGGEELRAARCGLGWQPASYCRCGCGSNRTI